MRKIFESLSVHHGQGVTCATLGPRSGSVLATGGRDKEICIWTLTEKDPVQTLTGFVSHVECVSFSWNEYEIAGGNTSGAIKLWDIRKGQTLCSLAGHRGKVKCLAQSQFEDHFWASGAFDGNVKLWDTRSCQLVATYRGHSNKTVTCMEFSPDGRWVVTGGEDCIIKLWDIAAGKALAELSGHSGPLTAVQFHPNEYLLASSSQDKTVRFWDMETYECVSQSAPDPTGDVRYIIFDSNGRCLYSASSGSGIRVLGWEPARVFDSESCPTQWTQQWRGVTTLGMPPSGHSVVAACLTDGTGVDSAVTVFGIDAIRLRPVHASMTTVTGDQREEIANNNDLSTGNPMRRSFHQRRNDTSTGSVEDANCGNNCTSPKVTINEHVLAFSSRPKLNRSPPNTPVPCDPTTPPVTTPHHVSSQPNLGATFTVVDTTLPQRLTTPAASALARSSSPARCVPAVASKSVSSLPLASQQKPKTTAMVSPMHAAKSSAIVAGLSPKVVHEVTPQVRPAPLNSKSAIPLGKAMNTANGNACQAAASSECMDQTSDDQCGEEIQDGDAGNLGRTFTLTPDDFMPKHQPGAAVSSAFTVFTDLQSSTSYDNHQMSIVTEGDCLVAVEKSCQSMSTVLDHRQRILAMCRTTWKNRGPISALELACQLNDTATVVDLLNILNFRSNMWKLDLCVVVLPQLQQLLESKYDTYVHTAVSTLRVVLRGYGQIIKNGLQAGNQVPSIGVDISLEERISKCQKCHNELLAIRESVQRKNKLKGNTRTDRNAHTYRELALLMNSLDI